MGNGDGSFQAPVAYAVGLHHFSVAVADLNGDGIPDIVTGYSGVSGKICVLLGNGDGTFEPPTSFRVGPLPATIFVAVGDFRGNGILDVAVADGPASNSLLGYVQVLLGNGDGTFQAPVTYALGSRSYAIAVADLSGDGTPDLIATDLSAVWVLQGNGDGSFSAPLPFASGMYPLGVTVSSFTEAGRSDLAVTSVNAHSVRVMLNDGNWPGHPGEAPRIPGMLGRADAAVPSPGAAVATGLNCRVEMPTPGWPSVASAIDQLLVQAAEGQPVPTFTGMPPRSTWPFTGPEEPMDSLTNMLTPFRANDDDFRIAV
jgi:hypothetical protein